MRRLILGALLAAGSLAAATKIVVTVVEHKSGAPVTNLEAKDFAVFDDKTPREVQDAAFTSETLDLMMLLDTSLAGGAVQPAVENFVAQLGPKEQMAVVGFDSSADLIQDFTGSKELLHKAVARLKFGNKPDVVGAIYATAPLVVVLGRYCNLDAILTLFVTWACTGWLGWLDGSRRRPPWSAYLAMALGTLLKGPVAVLLPGLTAMAVAVRRGAVRELLARARPAHGALVILALTFPWLAGTALAEPDYLRTFFVEHNFRRYLSSEFDHVRDSTFFLWALPALLLPWSLLVPAVIGRPPAATTNRSEVHRWQSDLAVWAAVVVVFFSLGRAKLGSYVLPAVPPVALWLGSALADLDRIRFARLVCALRLWGGVLLLLPVGIFLWASAAYPELAGASVWSLVAIPVGIAVLAASRRRPGLLAVPALAAGNAALFAVFYLAVAPTVSEVASDHSLARLAASHPEMGLAGFRVQPASFSFYSEREVLRLDDIKRLRARLQDGPLFLVSRHRHEAALAAAGITVHEWSDTGRHVLYATVAPPARRSDP